LVSKIDLRLRLIRNPVHMAQIELIPERRADGTVVLRAVTVGPVDRVRRWLRRLLQG
jgi:hypothetical protein